ncbi:MAG: fibronectin type III domain-containing protein [Frankiaceae bacterium]
MTAVLAVPLISGVPTPWTLAVPTASATSSSGVSLLSAAGQFTPLPGTPVLDSRNGTGLSAPNLAPGSTLTFSVTNVGGTATGVPANASAVVLEYNTQANFAGVLSTGSAAGATDTSLTFPANVERNGFDIVTPASNGTVALAITGFSPIPSGAVLSRLVVRLHGYHSGASTTTAGSTYVGYDPALLASSSNSPSGFTLYGNPTSGPLVVGTPPGKSAANAYTVQVTGKAGIPSDGSATAVALQTIVQDPTCSGGFSLTPAGSGRSDYDGSFTNGQDDENFDLIALPATGQLNLQLLGCTGTATVTIRVRGYYSAPTSSTPGSSYVPAQRKVFDTTTGTGTSSCPTTSDSPKLAAHSGCTIRVLGIGSFPSMGVSGLAAQIVAVNPGHDGWLGLYSDDTVAHTATLWYSPTGRTSNFEVASYTSVNPDGTVYVWNGGDYPVDVVIRVHGYFRAPMAPPAPTGVAASAQSGSATIGWVAPPTDGGAAISAYRVTARVDGASQPTVTLTVPATARTATLTGLDSQTSYVFEVAAVNGVGSSEPGEAPGVVPMAVRDALTELQAYAMASANGDGADWVDDPGLLPAYQLLSEPRWTDGSSFPVWAVGSINGLLGWVATQPPLNQPAGAATPTAEDVEAATTQLALYVCHADSCPDILAPLSPPADPVIDLTDVTVPDYAVTTTSGGSSMTISQWHDASTDALADSMSSGIADDPTASAIAPGMAGTASGDGLDTTSEQTCPTGTTPDGVCGGTGKRYYCRAHTVTPPPTPDPPMGLITLARGYFTCSWRPTKFSAQVRMLWKDTYRGHLDGGVNFGLHFTRGSLDYDGYTPYRTDNSYVYHNVGGDSCAGTIVSMSVPGAYLAYKSANGRTWSDTYLDWFESTVYVLRWDFCENTE